MPVAPDLNYEYLPVPVKLIDVQLHGRDTWLSFLCIGALGEYMVVRTTLQWIRVIPEDEPQPEAEPEPYISDSPWAPRPRVEP